MIERNDCRGFPRAPLLPPTAKEYLGLANVDIQER